MFFHDFLLPGLFFWWIFGHGVGSIIGILILLWVLGMIFHPWRWGYHPYYWRRSWGPPPPPPNANARMILEERYAKGDITREEYLQKKQDMGG
ncbi:MAG: SHOCT domain-containing protein [Rhizomicrobium sp.]